MIPKKTITVMPDFGMSPWAWEKDATDVTAYVGGNIADAVGGILEEANTLLRTIAKNTQKENDEVKKTKAHPAFTVLATFLS